MRRVSRLIRLARPPARWLGFSTPRAWRQSIARLNRVEMTIAKTRDQAELKRLKKRAAALRRKLEMIRPKVLTDQWHGTAFIHGALFEVPREPTRESVPEFKWCSFE